MSPRLKRLKIKEHDRRLPLRFYKSHLLHFPLLTVDLVVTNSKSQVLLVRRNSNNLNWKGQWATPGGRVYRNETILEAACRILERETRIRIRHDELSFRGFEEILTSKEHGVTLIFSAPTQQSRLSVDETSSSIRWFGAKDLPPSLKMEYRSILTKGGMDL